MKTDTRPFWLKSKFEEMIDCATALNDALVDRPELQKTAQRIRELALDLAESEVEVVLKKAAPQDNSIDNSTFAPQKQL